EAGALDEPGVFGNEHAAAGGRDDLVSVEGEDAADAETPRLRAVITRPQGLGGILDKRNFVLSANVDNAVVVGALPIQIDADDRLRQSAFLRPVAQLLTQQVRIEVPRGGVRINEDRAR